MSQQPAFGQMQDRIEHLEREVKQLKKVEQQLKDSEQRYRQIFENLQDVYYEATLDGTILEISPSIEKFSLYKREELIGKSLYGIYADARERDVFVENMLKNGAVNDYEVYLNDKDASLHPCAVTAILARDSEGRPQKLIGSIRDISRRKHAELALQQVKEWSETILQTIQSGVLVIDAASHKIIDINRSTEEMIGADRDEIIGRVCHNFVCTNAQGECPITVKGKKTDEIETLLLRRDGGRTEILKAARGATIDGRNYLIESFIDISMRKQAERDALAHQERFKTFFSSVSDAIFVHPLQAEGFAPFIEVNDIACERYGYTRDEFLKLTAADITKKEDADRHAASIHRNRLLNTRRLSFESVHIKKSGEEFPVEINSNVVQQYGKPVILAVVRDISERKRAETEKSRIEEQNRQMQKVESIGRLAGGVAHDLNNILAPIIGYGELLAKGMSHLDVRRKSVDQVIQAGYRARDLVRQLLAFGRKQTLEYRTIDLNKTIERFENLLKRTIREDIEIEFDLMSNIPSIKADIGQIEQVVMNLCVNAQDAMPEGGKITLTTKIVEIDEKAVSSLPGTKAGSYILLSVSDTGCGMDDDTRKNIFEPFYTTKGEKGTGLGLSTVYGIVKQHSGNIWVDSETAKGSTFRVYLPVSDDAPVHKEIEGRPPDSLMGGETILLVEDNEQLLNLSNEILKLQGYTTLTARNGAEALKSIDAHEGNVDLVLTDVIMPDMNGKDLFAEISKKRPGIRVLYMSGYTDDVIARHGVLEEGTHFIPKPFSIDGLSLKVRKVLDSPAS